MTVRVLVSKLDLEDRKNVMGVGRPFQAKVESGRNIGNYWGGDGGE